MTIIRPTTTDVAQFYAFMGVEALHTHLEAIVGALKAAGVEVTPRAQCGLDEITECVVEHFAHNDLAALNRHNAKATAELQQLGTASPMGGV